MPGRFRVRDVDDDDVGELLVGDGARATVAPTACPLPPTTVTFWIHRLTCGLHVRDDRVGELRDVLTSVAPSISRAKS